MGCYLFAIYFVVKDLAIDMYIKNSFILECNSYQCINDSLDPESIVYFFGYLYVLCRLGSDRTYNAGIILNVATYIFLTRYTGLRRATWFIITCGL